MAYLSEQKLARSQYKPRGRKPSGVTVIHTAESILDTIGADTGAENVARYMVTRTTPGSYHDLVDADTAVHLVDYPFQAYQDGTGSNPHALSISFALRTSDWRTLSKERRAAFLEQAALAFARQQAWLKSYGYPATPLRRITRAQSDAEVPGFIGHGERDPGRRSDPGADFPWAEFLDACAHTLHGTPAPKQPTPPAPEDDDMKPTLITAPERGLALAGVDFFVPITEHDALLADKEYGKAIVVNQLQWDERHVRAQRIRDFQLGKA